MFKKDMLEHTKEDGFTLIEILASIAVPVFLNQRDKGMEASQKSGLRQIEESISLAKVTSGKSLYAIAGQNYHFGECSFELDPLTLDRTHSCWLNYFAVLKKISDTSGMDVSKLVDPYGRPYLINPNEAEQSINDCRTDFIGYWGRNYSWNKPSLLKAMPMTTTPCI